MIWLAFYGVLGGARESSATSAHPRARSGSPALLGRYLASAVTVRTADEGARVALVLLALAKLHNPPLGGALVAALMVPHVVAAPLAGALAATVRRRGPFYCCCLVVYGAALTATALLTGTAPVALLLLLTVVAGCCAPLMTGGLTSLLGDLVPQERRTRAFGLDAVSYNLAGICGPALAAGAAALAGPTAALALLGLAAVAGGLMLLAVPLRPAPAVGPHSLLPRREDVTAGCVAIWREPRLRAVTAASSVGQLGIGALPLLCAALAVRYHASWATGGLLTAFAAGALLGSLAYARHPYGSGRPERVVVAGLLASGLPLAFLPLAPGPWTAAVLFGVSGFFTGPLFTALLASRESYSPPAARTQVFTLGAGLKSTAAAAGAVAGGLGVTHGPAAMALAVSAAQLTAAALGKVLLRQRPRTPSAAAVPADADGAASAD